MAELFLCQSCTGATALWNDLRKSTPRTYFPIGYFPVSLTLSTEITITIGQSIFSCIVSTLRTKAHKKKSQLTMCFPHKFFQSEATMRAVFILAIVAALATIQVVLSAPAEGDKAGSYTTRFDNINLDEVLASDRLLKNYFDCLMDRKPCTAEGTELKARIPEALKTECAKCTPKQREGSEKAIRFLMKNKPDMWKELAAKYDPTGEFTKKYADRLKEVA